MSDLQSGRKSKPIEDNNTLIPSRTCLDEGLKFRKDVLDQIFEFLYSVYLVSACLKNSGRPLNHAP